MKFYETHFEDYIKAVNHFNIHSDIEYNITNITEFNNLIMYGSPGIGKYSQTLHLLKRFSPSELKYEKKMKVKTDKHEYQYKMSDIHFEIDMSFLGCNSKILWHEIYFQIVDIISVNPNKIGIIVCKNFHKIHSELLDIFYSYIQHFNTKITNIQVKFILLTEHVSFIPSNIINVCEIIKLKRPSKETYHKMINEKTNKSNKPNHMLSMLNTIELENIINLKEIYSFSLVKKIDTLPEDIFNTVCDQIIKEIENYEDLNFIQLRDVLYNILVYNLDMTECLWYILTYFINSKKLSQTNISDILNKSYITLKYYNNNYRPIYHLESIIYYIINKLYIG